MTASRLIVPGSPANYTICTSSTRPASPVKGALIYETDTDKLLQYTTATTGWVPPWNMPWGVLGYVQVTASQATISTVVDVTSLTLTTTFVGNRRIRLTGYCLADQVTTGGTTSLVITDATPTTIASAQADILAAKRFWFSPTAIVTPAAGSKLYKLRMSTTAGTVTMTAASNVPAYFMVEDVGPSAAPA